MSAAEEETREFHTRSLSLGSKIIGGVLGALTSYATGMPVLGAALSPFVAQSLERVGTEMIHRQLAPRQAARVGRAITAAAVRIRELEEEGRKPRTDGFFDTAPGDDRSTSDEITEAMLQAAMNASQERKVDFIALLLANIAFDDTIDSSTAHLLIQTAESSSYRVFVLLELISDIDVLTLPKREGGASPPPASADLAPLLVEIYGMTREGLIGMKDTAASTESYAILGIDELDPARLRLTDFGRLLHSTLELARLPKDDTMLRDTGSALGRLARTRGQGVVIDGGTF